ncbi:MAG: leucine-rich repeat protein [Eubacteriales bacterium]
MGIQPGLGFTVETLPQVIMTGENARFTIKALDGYQIIGFSYSNYQSLGDGVYEFMSIRYPTMIEVYYTASDGIQTTPDNPSTSPAKSWFDISDIQAAVYDPAYANSIIYCFNGGTYIGAETACALTVFPDTTHHQRVNVINGNQTLVREGYTLIGWNTAADGSGTHVSLGSRCTLNKNGALVLYASWVKWSEESNFTYTVTENEAHITGYRADEQILSLPGTLGGYPVTRICEGAFRNLNCEKVILPDSVKIVDSKAFTSCALTTLHFFDTVTSINDDSFASCDNFSTIFINQYKAPVYITTNGKVEAYDSLILSEKKSIVFFAGSSVLYGIDAYRASESFYGTEYDVINLGWTAPRNAIFQMEIITALLDEGDIFIHAPEYISNYHLMNNITMGSSAWQVIDCNLDLFSYVDIRTVPKSLSSFCTFTKDKDNAQYTCTYDDYCSSMDLLGYKCSDRPVIHSEDWAPDGSCKITASLLSDTGISRLRTLYSAIEKKGVKVYLTYPPLDENYIEEDSGNPETRQGYIDRFESIGYTVIGRPEDFFYDGSYFHDTEFHLITKGAEEHTDKVIRMLKEQMRKDGLLGEKELWNASSDWEAI